MIRMIQSVSAKAAKHYFNEGLSKSDYYINDQELGGSFRGMLAQRMGIGGKASKEVFHALCENTHPLTGKRITPRKVDNRTIGYDINFHCPKSVSILHVLSKDDHILKSFQDSVNEIMCDIESDVKTRIRKNGQDDDRDTGELLWADFVHQTARPTKEQAADPHLHCHCYTFNLTWDDVEKRYKAGQFRDIKRDMPYYQAKFYKNLSDKLMELGYGIIKTKTSFEIAGVPDQAIDLFSKRTKEINQLAQKRNVKNVEKKAQLGSQTRAKKQKGSTMLQLKNDWKRQIKKCGLVGNKANGIIIRYNPHQNLSKDSVGDCISHAVAYRFERDSVVQDRRILETAFLFALGKRQLKASSINTYFNTDTSIIKVQEKSKTFCTTKDVIAQERELLNLAARGNDTIKPLYKSLPKTNLSMEQHKAVCHALTTADRIAIIEGRAGTGKTTLMKETINLIEKTGKRAVIVAPTSQAARGVLRNEGFSEAETVAQLLCNPALQESLKDQVLWVDEAGLLGIKDMIALLALAAYKNAKVILSGDTRQHSSVARGDALRLLIDLGGISVASLTTIYRQKAKGYRDAVYALSRGDAASCFKKMDALDSIRELKQKDRTRALAFDYLNAIKIGKTALVVSPTHKQGDEITQAIRKELKKSGKLCIKEVKVKKLVNLNMTEAEKGDSINYKRGYVLQFNQNRKGIKRGSAWKVEKVGNEEIHIRNDAGIKTSFLLKEEQAFDIYTETDLLLSKGDSIRITRNGFDKNKKRFDNGTMLTIQNINKKGDIIARTTENKSTFKLPRDFAHLTYGYCLTSHASQGKTVDEVFIYQPSETFPATDLKQFYVSVSRGRDKVHIYTDDKPALLDHASKMRDRRAGLELLKLSAIEKCYSKRNLMPVSTDQRLHHRHRP